MIVRLWKTKVKTTALPEYEENERTRSTPMFKEQPGCLGVLFLRFEDECVALTFWSDWDAVNRLKTSKSYLEASAFYSESGMLTGEPSLQVFTSRVSSGFVLPMGAVGAVAQACGANAQAIAIPWPIASADRAQRRRDCSQEGATKSSRSPQVAPQAGAMVS
jgi:heme-degrading monooxygenase HmoA